MHQGPPFLERKISEITCKATQHLWRHCWQLLKTRIPKVPQSIVFSEFWGFQTAPRDIATHALGIVNLRNSCLTGMLQDSLNLGVGEPSKANLVVCVVFNR